MAEPPENALNDIRRQVFATVAVRIEALRSAQARSALCAEYAKLKVDGYWVKIDGLSEAARLKDITAVGTFLAELREIGKAVVSDQPGLLHLALLADDFSVAIGIAEGERFSFPKNWAKETEGRERKGRVRSTYHPKFLLVPARLHKHRAGLFPHAV